MADQGDQRQDHEAGGIDGEQFLTGQRPGPREQPAGPHEAGRQQQAVLQSNPRLHREAPRQRHVQLAGQRSAHGQGREPGCRKETAQRQGEQRKTRRSQPDGRAASGRVDQDEDRGGEHEHGLRPKFRRTAQCRREHGQQHRGEIDSLSTGIRRATRVGWNRRVPSTFITTLFGLLEEGNAHRLNRGARVTRPGGRELAGVSAVVKFLDVPLASRDHAPSYAAA